MATIVLQIRRHYTYNFKYGRTEDGSLEETWDLNSDIKHWLAEQKIPHQQQVVDCVRLDREGRKFLDCDLALTFDHTSDATLFKLTWA